jgi:soluble lytic murein transglycosylase-like protein
MIKKTNLPTLKITNAFGDASIKIKKNRWLQGAKWFVAVVILSIASAGYTVAMSTYQEYVVKQNYAVEETQKALSGEKSTVIQAAAEIIKRDAKVPTSKEVATKYALWVYQAASKYSVDPTLILSVMRIESQFDYKATSPTGARGLMQVIASWHREKTSDVALYDPKNAIFVGTQILAEYDARSKTDIEMLLRYNGSLGQAPIYATKVLLTKKRYDDEIYRAIINGV